MNGLLQRLVMIVCGLVAVFTCAAAPLFAAEPQAADIDFNRDVRPILTNNCLKCHGPDDHREAGLRLDDPRSATAELESGSTAIVPGKPDESELVRRILSDDADEVMPPPTSNKHLTDIQKDLLRRWIAAGAQYQPHWSLVPPTLPPLPKVSDPAWPKNEIDHFVLARLDAEGLKPSVPADPYTLVRRVYLDLIGLPPTLDEADAFVNDHSANAYENLVDRLLASPHYGERWARRWLDLARYADTNGYEKDRPRSMWPYRDWVIQAINDDMPFDRFTIEQIAGDMLPSASLQQAIASGFHRNTMVNEEGGIDPQEFRFQALVDRVGTTGAVWLGLTVGCAQCHTHKYDPITQREFYQLMAFYDQADEPMISVPTGELQTRRAEIERQIATLEADLPNRYPIEQDFEFVPVQPGSFASAAGAELTLLDDGSILAGGATPEKDTYTLTVEAPLDRVSAIRVEALADPALPSKGPGRTPHGNFVLSTIEATLAPTDGSSPAQNLKFARAEADYAQPGFGPAGAIDTDPATGWAIHEPNNPNWNTNRTATFYLDQPINLAGPARLTIRLDQQHGLKHTLGRFRIALGRAVSKGDAAGTIAQQREGMLKQRFGEWVDGQSARAVRWTLLTPTELKSNVPTLTKLDDNSVLASGDQTKLDVYELTYANTLPKITAIRLDALPDESLPAGGPGRVYYEGPPGDFFLSEMKCSVAGEPMAFTGAVNSFADGGNTAANAVDGKTETGWNINGGQGRAQWAVFKLAQPLAVANNLALRMEFEKYYAAALGRFRISVTDDPRPIDQAGLPAEVEMLLAKPSGERTAAELEQLFKHYLSVAPELAAARNEIDELRKQMPQFPTTLVMRQRQPDQYRQTNIHYRGEYLQPKDPVEPGVLAALHALPVDAPRDRLALARWLVDRKNPLTARVAVNRHWAALFGRGIVRTTEDFGTQGEQPTHPELLDWLAVTYMDRGWSTKQLHRLIVTSATYRQSSRVTPELSQHDPLNKLLARGPRFRIEAELVRDVVLRASGLLSDKLGGPSVFPPQPAGITEGTYGGMAWNVSQGEDRYRRGLYTFQKRSAPYAMFSLFDSPSGEQCLVRRERSNTSLQALALLNDEFIFEAARALGQQTVERKDQSDEARATFVYRRCLVHPPDAQELERFTQFLAAQRKRLAAGELQGETIAGSPGADANERAAWTLLARAILNLDAVVSRE